MPNKWETFFDKYFKPIYEVIIRNQKINDKLYVIPIIILSFIMVSIYRGIITDDSFSYWATADSIYYNGSYASLMFGNENYLVRPPVYPLLIAFSFAFIGHSVLALHFFPYILTFLSPILLYAICIKISKNAYVALLSSCLFILSPPILFFANIPLTEGVFSFFLLLFILTYEFHYQKEELLPIVGVLGALLILTRYEGIFPVLIISLSLFYRKIYYDHCLSKWVIISIASFLATIAPFLLWNYINFAQIIPPAYQTMFEMKAFTITGNFMGLSDVYLNNLFGRNILFVVFIGLGILYLFKNKLPVYIVGIPLFWTIFLIIWYPYCTVRLYALRHLALAVPFICMLVAFGAKELYEIGVKITKKKAVFMILVLALSLSLITSLGMYVNPYGNDMGGWFVHDYIPGVDIITMIKHNPQLPVWDIEEFKYDNKTIIITGRTINNIEPSLGLSTDLREDLYRYYAGSYREYYLKKLEEKNLTLIRYFP